MDFKNWGVIFLVICLLVVASLVIRLVVTKKPKKRISKFMRGSSLKEAPGMVEPDAEHPYLLGQRFHSFSEMKKSVVIVGSPGSGKTVQLHLLLKTIVGEMVKEGSSTRALVYDSKSDLTALFPSMGLPEEQTKILNPLDKRCWAWDLAKEITSRSQAQDFAACIIPMPKDAKQPFFVDSARSLLRDLILIFQEHCPGEWELRDLIHATRSNELMAFLFAQMPETIGALQHFKPEDTFRSVKSTLITNLESLSFIAASWHRAKKQGRSFTFDDWFSSNDLLILGNSPTEKDPISKFNNFFLTQLSKRLLNRTGQRTEHNFFILDEFRELGRISSMPDWAGLGRSKGSCLCLGFQDVLGVDHVYGKEQSREILGNCANAVILHLNSLDPDSQKWASEVLGQTNFHERQFSGGETKSSAPGGGSTNDGWVDQNKTEFLWMPSMFGTELPPTSPRNGCKALCRFESQFYLTNIEGDHIFTEKGTHHRMVKPSKDYEFFDRLDDKEQLLTRWDTDDFLRLKIPNLNKIATIDPEIPTDLQERIGKALDIEGHIEVEQPSKSIQKEYRADDF